MTRSAQRDLFGVTNALINNTGSYTVTKNFNAVPHFTIGSNTASLNGRFDVFGMRNELTLATNGYINSQYSYRNSIAQVLGNATLANPIIFPRRSVPFNGGQYKSGVLSEQSIITADTLHFTDKWAVQGVLNTSFLDSKSYNASGRLTSSDSRDGALSPTVSLIYKPIPKITTYATFANSIEQGEVAPTGTANANAILSPYTDRTYEVG